MKILVLSLLRTGDLFMHQMLFQSIKRKYPRCELHVLVNDLNDKAVELIEEIDQVHILPRNYLQKYVVEENRPWIKSYQHLRDLVKKLNTENYDFILNATHTFFSARLMDALVGSEKRGVQFKEGISVPSENEWSHYLNLHYHFMNEDSFHYIEVLAHSLGFDDIKLKRASFTKPVKENESFQITFQILTSDIKKNWPIKYFSELADIVKNRYPKAKIVAIGAPDERQVIEEQLKDNKNVILQFPKWNEVESVIGKSKILVTGDTSIQHLAVMLNIPVLSLFLGSANVYKTGPYQNEAVILHSKAACFPCHHSEKCHQKSQYCADEMNAKSVFTVLQKMLCGGLIESNELEIKQVRANFFNQYSIYDVKRDDRMMNHYQNLKKIIWKTYLNGSLNKDIGLYYSVAQNFIYLCKEDNQENVFTSWLSNETEMNRKNHIFIDEIEKKLMQHACVKEKQQEESQVFFFDLQAQIDQFLVDYKNRKDYFFELKNCLEQTLPPFELARRVKSSLHSTRQLLNIESQFLSAIDYEYKERNLRQCLQN